MVLLKPPTITMNNPRRRKKKTGYLSASPAQLPSPTTRASHDERAHAPDAIATTTEDDVITCLYSTFTDDADDANHFTQLSHVAALPRPWVCVEP